MKRGKKIIFSLLITFLLAACSGVAKEYMEKYDLGMRFLNEGNYEEAVLAFTAAIDIDDKLPDAFIGRGDAYILWADSVNDVMEEKTELALADFLKAIDLDKKNADTYVKAADIYISNGDLEAAKALLEKGVQRTGNDKLKKLLESIEEKMEDGFSSRGTFVSFEKILDKDTNFINQIISNLESGNISSAHDMLLQDQFGKIIKAYENEQVKNIFYTQNEEYKIRMFYDGMNAEFEIHPNSGMGYGCGVCVYEADRIDYDYLEGTCSNWNWNGSYEKTREGVPMVSGGYDGWYHHKGTAKDGLVHGSVYIEKGSSFGGTQNSEKHYDMGVSLNEESKGRLERPSGWTSDGQPQNWDWNI